MDESGRGALALAVTLQGAHFRLRNLVRGWEQLAPVGSVSRCEALGPAWHSSDRDRPAYFDGHALVLEHGGAVSCELSMHFDARGVDFTIRAALESEDGENGRELLTTGPLEFPASADNLATEINHCLERLEQVDISSVLRAECP